MEITNVKVHLKESHGSKLKAFVTITFDEMFVVRDLKVIEGKNGPFVAMPSIKMKEPCVKCSRKIPIRSKFCPECGARLPEVSFHNYHDEEHREDHKDIAHPITAEARDIIQKKVLEAYYALTDSSNKYGSKSKV
ncbi:MAG: septation protein SpoVG family protein [Chlamydiae bacterium]|nr:septation protein SpoVG family protein [Chlamydiota bacterium]MBI3277559.1 septation protein SpoVG family protein [Chlamydiota bacterium]